MGNDFIELDKAVVHVISLIDSVIVVFILIMVLKARILKWFAIPFFSGPCIVKTLHHGLSCWVALYGMSHSFIELDKAVVHVISLISFL